MSEAISPLDESTQASLRREHIRVPVAVEVTATSGHNFWTGFTQNMSAGGVFLATDLDAPIGAILEFELAIPGGPPVAVRAEVRWTREASAADEHQPAGLGLRFLGLSDPLARRIEAFIESQRESLFFDDEV
jgi:uncharacterized protein (TIGR02266 family)